MIQPIAMTESDLNRARLAEFLRNRRRQLQPGDFGLPTGKRRRTAGLRREDVAELAGISLAYYSWIEQARDLHLSREVISSLATALRLNQAERKYIFTLAGIGFPEEFADDAQHLHPTVGHLVGDDSTECAMLCDPWLNVRAASPLARRILLASTESWPQQNLIWRLCHDRAYASLWPDRQGELRLVVGMFRQNLASDPQSLAGNRVLEELNTHPFFASVWMTNEVQLNPSPEDYFREEPWELTHRSMGRFRIHRIGIALPKPNKWALIIFSPADDESRRKFAHVLLSPQSVLETDGVAV
jgi:transcriptional regulator with XRE-family HTH domain